LERYVRTSDSYETKELLKIVKKAKQLTD